MRTLATKYLNVFGTDLIDIEELAVEKDQNWEEEKTVWIFEDGSAICQTSFDEIDVIDDYGLSADHEQL